MILDDTLEMSDAQSVSGSIAAVVVSTNVPDFGADGTDGWGTTRKGDIGEGGGLVWTVGVDTALVGAGAIITATLVTKAADVSISSGATTLATLTIPALSAAGYKKAVRVPPGTTERYVGVLYTISGAALTSSKLNSYLSLDTESHGLA